MEHGSNQTSVAFVPAVNAAAVAHVDALPVAAAGQNKPVLYVVSI